MGSDPINSKSADLAEDVWPVAAASADENDRDRCQAWKRAVFGERCKAGRFQR